MRGDVTSIAAPALWLDTTGIGPHHLPGVHGCTQWIDCLPGRGDLPRTMAEIPSLAIADVDLDRFTPPAERPGLLYRRTDRPGQGRLSGKPTLGLSVVLISVKHDDPAAVRALRDWGDFVHIAEIAATAVPGYTMITPYEVVGEGPRFLHLYEMDTDDPEAAFQAMTPLVQQRVHGAAFRSWAWHDELRIDYVSSYRLVR